MNSACCLLSFGVLFLSVPAAGVAPMSFGWDERDMHFAGSITFWLILATVFVCLIVSAVRKSWFTGIVSLLVMLASAFPAWLSLLIAGWPAS